ncbi:MAG: hypothetical protein U9P44_03570, partial [archaeon]|nr:hypothetical protein [archaeon]
MVGHLFGRSDVQTAGVSWWGRYGISVLTIIIVAGLIGFGYANMQAYNEQDVTATGNNAFSKHDVPGLGMPYDRVLAGVGIPVALFDDYSDVLYLFLVPFLLVLV